MAYIKKSTVNAVNVTIKNIANTIDATRNGLSKIFSSAIANTIVTSGNTKNSKIGSIIYFPPAILYLQSYYFVNVIYLIVLCWDLVSY